MKVISFNIRCCDDKDGHSIDERAPRLKALLYEQVADVIGFQEVTPPWMRHISNDYGEKYEIYNKYRDTEKREGCTILWKKDKYELIDQGCFWFSDTPWVSSMGGDTVCHCKRICTWVILSEKDSLKRFALFNMHFGFGDSYQLDSVELLHKTAVTVGEKNTLMLGDFNFGPGSVAYQRAAEYFDDANALLENDQRSTYHGYGTCADARIDHLFLMRGGARPTAYKLLAQSYCGKYPSDHYGIMFNIEM